MAPRFDESKLVWRTPSKIQTYVATVAALIGDDSGKPNDFKGHESRLVW